VAISTVAGIVAALGVHEVLQKPLNNRAAIIKAMSVPVMILLFAGCAYSGVHDGAVTRSPSYPRIVDIVGQRWDHSDPAIISDVHAFRMRARFARMSSYDYQQFMVDAVAPIINDDKPEKVERVRETLAKMESAFPRPEPKADDKPQPKEPAEPGKTE
jgi:hypothetical protein